MRRAGRQVRLWLRDEELSAAINDGCGNPTYLPDIPLEDGIRAGTDMGWALDGAAAAFIVVPAQAMGGICRDLAAHMPDGLPLVLCAKGVERGSLKRMSMVAAEILPRARIGVLSGPTFADEVARNLPAAAALATADGDAGRIMRDALAGPRFRPYLCADMVGVELGGAVKNVIAIACGVAMGRGLGENARAALLARGLAEMTRLVCAMGGEARTCAGLSGLGDLSLTANSAKSRNTSFGIKLGAGEDADTILAARRGVTEGFWSAAAVTGLAAQAEVEMPICAATAGLLSGRFGVDDAIDGLLSRPPDREYSGRQ